MKLAILTANLNSFDRVVKPVDQALPDGIDQIDYHCFTDSDFPPITGLTPRFQYRIPKFFGWQTLSGAEYYIWLDGAVTLDKEDSVKWFIEQLGEADMAVFKHPWRKSIKEEADHIEEHLIAGKPYITSRYKNGLHKEQLAYITDHGDPDFKDDKLFASTAFIYRNTHEVNHALTLWWTLQSRYYTCDQLAMPYALWVHDLKINVINENPFKASHLKHVSRHK